MQQLVMHWKNDNIPGVQPTFSAEFSLVTLPELENGVEIWLDIVQHGLSKGRMDASYYQKTMTDVPWYEETKCFFVTYRGEPVATVTVICDRENRKGNVHMVACRPDCRGMGIGNLLVDIAVYTLKAAEMETAYLLTDDFRIPAICAYLKGGFTPDLSTEDYVQRWNAIYRQIGVTPKEM